MNPILHVSINPSMHSRSGYITAKKFAQTFKKILGSKYKILFTPSNIMDVKADNMVTLKIDNNTNIENLIKDLERIAEERKEENHD